MRRRTLIVPWQGKGEHALSIAGSDRLVTSLRFVCADGGVGDLQHV